MERTRSPDPEDDHNGARGYLPAPIRGWPGDLLAVCALTALVNLAVFLPLVRATPLRVPLALAFALFVPGYVAVAALFPAARGEDPPGDRFRTGALTGVERFVFSVGLSVMLVPLGGVLIDQTSWNITLGPVMVVLTAFTFGGAAVAAHRRQALPADDQFRVEVPPLLERTTDHRDQVLTIALALSVVLLLASVGYAVAFTSHDDEFSSIAVLTEREDGEFVLGETPRELERGDTTDVLIEVTNEEGEDTPYTLVALEQSITVDGNDVGVDDQRERDRLEFDLAAGETGQFEDELEPTTTGDVRFVWLLYVDGDVPEDPSGETADYETYLTLEVSEES